MAEQRTRRRPEHPYQLPLSADAAHASLPGQLPGEQVCLLHETVGVSRLWESVKPQSAILILDETGTHAQAEITKNNLVIIPHHPDKPVRYGASIILLPFVTAQEEDLVAEQLARAQEHLGKEGAVFIIEQRHETVSGLGPDRKKIMQEAGLVKVAVREAGNEYIVWEGRLPKERLGLRKPVNLVREDSPHLDYYRMLWRQMIASYKQAGFTVTDHHELLNELHATRNPPETISRLKNGFGVTIRASGCACQAHIALNGTTTESRCRDHPDAMPSFEAVPAVKMQKEGDKRRYIIGVPYVIPGYDCWDCFQPFKRTVQAARKHGETTTLTIYETCSCHDRTFRTDVPTSQVVIPPKKKTT